MQDALLLKAWRKDLKEHVTKLSLGRWADTKNNVKDECESKLR